MSKDKKTVPRAEKIRLQKEKQAREKEERDAEKQKNREEYQAMLLKKESEEQIIACRHPNQEVPFVVEGTKSEAKDSLENPQQWFSESDDFVTITSLGTRSFWKPSILLTVLSPRKLAGFRAERIPNEFPSQGQSSNEDEAIEFILYQSQAKSNHFKLSVCVASSLDVLYEVILVIKSGDFTLEYLKQNLSTIFIQRVEDHAKTEHDQAGRDEEISPSERNHQMAQMKLEERKNKEKLEYERQKQCEESSNHEATIKDRRRKLDSKVGKDQSRNYAERDADIVSGKERGKYSMKGH